MQSRKTIIFILLFCCVIYKAQNSKTDSLLLLLKSAKADSNRINTLNELAWVLRMNKPDTAIHLSSQALALAQKLPWKKGTAQSYKQIGAFYVNKGDYTTALVNYKLALSIWEELSLLDDKALSASGKKGKSITLGNIGVIYVNQGDYKKGIEHYSKALKIAEETNDKNKAATWLVNIAVVYISRGDYREALDHCLKAVAIAEEIIKQNKDATLLNESKNILAACYNNIGIISSEQGNYPQSLNYYLKALVIYEEMNNKIGIATQLGNLGNIYFLEGNYTKALEYYLKGLKMDEELGDKQLQSSNLCNIGSIYSEKNDYYKALEYYFKALELAAETGFKHSQSQCFSNIGNIYQYLGDSATKKNNSALAVSRYDKSANYFFKAIEIDKELGDKNGIARNFGCLGSLYILQKKYTEAEKFLLKAIRLDKEIGALNEQMTFEKNLSALYEKTNRDDLALEHYKNAIIIKDTLFTEEKNKELTKKEMSYEFEKKEAASKAEQDKKDAVTSAEGRKQKAVLGLVCFVLILVFGFALFIFRSLKLTRKQKLVIEIKNKETEYQKNVIEEKNKDILDSIHYAKRIQTSLLPTEKYIARVMKR